MRQAIHAGFFVAVIGAVAIWYPATACAQDPQSLCAKSGDDDRVRPIPAGLIPPARQLFGFSADTPDSFIRRGTSFRCMRGDVWLCNYGANLVCGKANTSRTSEGAADFCRENPGSDVVPMAATGHDTIYAWKCVGNQAQISRQAAAVDARGFIAGNWRRLEK